MPGILLESMLHTNAYGFFATLKMTSEKYFYYNAPFMKWGGLNLHAFLKLGAEAG